MSHPTVSSLAQAVAAELHMTAEPGPAGDESDAWLTCGQERLHVCAYANRIVVVGSFPSTRHPAAVRNRPEITVNAGRGPAVIAREISRRLLPRYRAVLAEVNARNAADAAEAAARNEIAATVTATFPAARGQWPVSVRQEPLSTVLHLDTARGWGNVRIAGDATTMHLDLRDVPAAAALRMLTALADETGEQSAPCEECGQLARSAASADHGPACSLHPSAIAS